jgi:hypothetical protein
MTSEQKEQLEAILEHLKGRLETCPREDWKEKALQLTPEEALELIERDVQKHLEPPSVGYLLHQAQYGFEPETNDLAGVLASPHSGSYVLACAIMRASEQKEVSA